MAPSSPSSPEASPAPGSSGFASPSYGLPPGTAPPSQRPSRLPLYIGAVVVVIVIVLVTLIATGVLSSLLSPSGTSGGDLTYSEAEPIASQAASGYDGGGWSVLIAGGVDTSTQEVVPVNSTGLASSDCDLDLAAGVTNDVTVPSFTGNRTAGIAPAWEFLYRNGANTVLLVLVVDARATVIGTISGGDCTFVFDLLSAVPSTITNSPQAGSAVAADAAAFLGAHPSANTTYALEGGVTLLDRNVGPQWDVRMTTCAFGPSATGIGATFNATVNATSGAVVYDHTNPADDCAE